MNRVIAVIPLLLCVSAGAGAQSALSVQGFGYPTGGLSTRSLSVGGASAGIDPVSTLNPAALSLWGEAGLAVQFVPELRTVRGPSEEGSTTTIRFPVYSAGLRVNNRVSLGASSSTLLDQSWSTRSTVTQVVGSETVQTTLVRTTLGAINDLRIAGAYTFSPSLRAGFGLHLIAGSNVVSLATDFSTNEIADLSLRTDLGYTGSAVSAGVLWTPFRGFTMGVSGRSGGSLKIKRDSVELGRASVPDRMGASLQYAGLPGAIFNLGYDKVLFSEMNGLGTAAATARDTEDFGFGVEVTGPSILRNPSLVRVGARRRGLPFDALDAKVMETSYSAGLGVSVAQRRAMFDLGVIRVFRDNNSAFRESAWMFATGILVRP